MMISPDCYYDTYLKGKNQKQIITAIRGLKQQIGELKNIMEHPDYSSALKVCPDESVRLECGRLYLERAKQALMEAGTIYSPSKAELRAESFDASVSAISKIVFSIGGCFDGYEKYTITMDKVHLHFDVEHSFYLKPSNLPDGLDYPCGKREFLNGIRALHIGEWRPSYRPKRFGYSVLDGTQWDLRIEFSNGHRPFKVCGDNSYPYNFNSFKRLLGIGCDSEESE